MNVLIVEDDDEKLNILVDFVRSTYGVSEIDVAKSQSSGLVAALAGGHDLVLLDMTMRNFDRTVTEDGGRPHAFAGREILRQMNRYGIDAPVIVVTNFDRFGDEADYTTLDQLKAELRSRFPCYVDTVLYRSNVDEWKMVLGQILEQKLGWSAVRAN